MTESGPSDQRLRDRAMKRAAMRPTRSVRRARALMGRSHGRKAEKAAVRVAAFDLAGARDALRLISASRRLKDSRAGVMPHTPRKAPRVKLRPHLGDQR